MKDKSYYTSIVFAFEPLECYLKFLRASESHTFPESSDLKRDKAHELYQAYSDALTDLETVVTDLILELERIEDFYSLYEV